MATNTLSILKPSVNNLTTRIFVRAAGLDFDEIDVWGKKSEPGFMAKDPAALTPLLEEEGLPRGALWESCAIMQYLCNKHGLDRFYPTDPGQRAMVDSAMFYLTGHALSAAHARDVSGPRLPPVRRRGRHVRGRRRAEGQGAEGRRGGARRAARGLPLVLPRRANVHRRGHAVDRRHPPRRVARVPARDRLPVPRLGRGVHVGDRGVARRGIHRAGGGRPRLHRLRQVTELSDP